VGDTYLTNILELLIGVNIGVNYFFELEHLSMDSNAGLYILLVGIDCLF